MPEAADTLPRSVAEARKIGSSRYFTGKPCVHGHVAPRATSSMQCCGCITERYAALYARRKDEQNRRNRERYANDPEYRAKILRVQSYKETRLKVNLRRKQRYHADPVYREKMLALRRVKVATPEVRRKLKSTMLKVLYGITLNEYNHILARQNGVCAICGNPPTRHLDVDHCHKTGRVRGLLCNNCNRGLSLFSDEAAMVLKAFHYLESNDVY